MWWMEKAIYPLSETEKNTSKVDLVALMKFINKKHPAQPSLSESERELLKNVFLKGVTHCVHR